METSNNDNNVTHQQSEEGGEGGDNPKPGYCTSISLPSPTPTVTTNSILHIESNDKSPSTNVLSSRPLGQISHNSKTHGPPVGGGSQHHSVQSRESSDSPTAQVPSSNNHTSTTGGGGSGHRVVVFQRERSSSSMSEVEGELAELDLENKKKNKALLSRQRRTRSLYGASPSCKFGPKASIMQNQANILTIQDPGTQRLTWYKPPLSVLIIKKIFDDIVITPFVELVTWLVEKRHMLVFIEAKTFDDSQLKSNSSFLQVRHKLHSFREGEDDLTDKIDFIICLGGDGTLLYASSLFQESVPPVMAFHLGSLGFLGPFDFSNFREKVTQVLEGNAALTLRTRLKCVVNKSGTMCSTVDGSDACSIKHVESKQHILVLNEVVVDRGPSPYICNIDLFIEHKYITSVQGDGLIISTPTGSTAYAAAAGASMIHPNVPAILIAPVCPHSLSFRPIVVPAGVEIKIMISPEARSNAWVSFDGRQRQELFKGDVLRISTSIYPVPSICSQDQISDWFESLAGCLHWNVRKQQRAFMYHNTSAESLNDSSSDYNSNGKE